MHYNEVVLPMMATKYHWQVQGNFTTLVVKYLGYNTPRMNRKQVKQAIEVFEEIVKDPNCVKDLLEV